MSDAGTTQSVLEYAISLEQRAVDLYTDLAHMAQDNATKEAFLEFAEEEMGHRKKLEDVLEGKAFISARDTVTDLKISDYTVEVILGDKPDYQDILLFAIEQEKKASVLYNDLASRVEKPELKELFLALAAEEAKHKHRFELEYDENVLKDN